MFTNKQKTGNRKIPLSKSLLWFYDIKAEKYCEAEELSKTNNVKIGFSAN